MQVLAERVVRDVPAHLGPLLADGDDAQHLAPGCVPHVTEPDLANGTCPEPRLCQQGEDGGLAVAPACEVAAGSPSILRAVCLVCSRSSVFR